MICREPYPHDFAKERFLFCQEFFLEQQKQQYDISEQGNASDAQPDDGNDPDDIRRFPLSAVDSIQRLNGGIVDLVPILNLHLQSCQFGTQSVDILFMLSFQLGTQSVDILLMLSFQLSTQSVDISLEHLVRQLVGGIQSGVQRVDLAVELLRFFRHGSSPALFWSHPNQPSPVR